MAELKFPSPSTWEEFELDTKLIDPPVIKLNLRPLFRKGQLEGFIAFAGIPGIEGLLAGKGNVSEAWPIFEKIVPVIMRHVIGWDLTLFGEPIPCTEENKVTWLEPLMWEAVKKRIEPVEAVQVVGFDPGKDDAEAGAAKEENIQFLWAELLTIIRDHENFRKN